MMPKMSTVNIPKDTIDPHFRYKRQVIQIVVTPKNGGTTSITNIKSIAKSLERPEDQITIFFKKNFKTQVSLKDSTISIRGTKTLEELECVLELFIKDYILCNHCGNPETKMYSISKQEKRICKACGLKSK